MSFVMTHPEALAATAGYLNGVGSVLAAQNMAAADSTPELPPVAADEVSALTATQFSAHAHPVSGSEHPSDSNARDVHLDFGHQWYFLCGYRSRQHYCNELTRWGSLMAMIVISEVARRQDETTRPRQGGSGR